MSGSAFTSEQARARFDEVLDGELSDSERARFDAALAADPELSAEFERLRAVLVATKQLGTEPVAVDLLSGVQHKLRARSGGRFYRDRFAERRAKQPGLALLIALSALFVLGVLFWFAERAGWLGGKPPGLPL